MIHSTTILFKNYKFKFDKLEMISKKTLRINYFREIKYRQ
jgi:hypothetical protein